MTQSTIDPVARQNQILNWKVHVEDLITQLQQWATSEGWSVVGMVKTLRDKTVGDFTVPSLTIELQGGAIHIDPIALLSDDMGRVDVEGFPTLNRVKLMGGREWEIMTDSNVPLRHPWSQKTFVQLARDLIS